MKTYKKYFIGKGKQVKGLNIIKATCNMDDLNALSYEFDGQLYITFEIAKMKQPDQFGREFTLYVNRKEEVADEPKPARQKSPAGKAAKSAKKVKETIDEYEEHPF